jgi:tetratricopeptide (TPR) repeat protein
LSAFEVRRDLGAASQSFTDFMAGLLNYKSGNYQAFLDRFALVLSQNDISTYVAPYDINFYIGVSHSVRQEPELAIQAYTQALKTNRKIPTAYNNRALAYINMGQLDQALKDCTLGLLVDNQNTLLFNTRGIVYLGLMDYDLANKNFDTVIALFPDDPRGYHNRGLAHQALGDASFAEADFKKEAELRKQK